jgi:hypothetical protein
VNPTKKNRLRADSGSTRKKDPAASTACAAVVAFWGTGDPKNQPPDEEKQGAGGCPRRFR